MPIFENENSVKEFSWRIDIIPKGSNRILEHV